MKVEVARQGIDILGEGPVWAAEEQALYWIDIWWPALQRWQTDSDEFTQWAMPAPIGSFALRRDGGALVALKTGLHRFDFETAQLALLANPEADRPDTRFNDGKCDRQGRFWVGSMDDDGESRPVGTLYRLDAGDSLHAVRGQVTVSNGLGWSPDNRTMYYTDSPTRTIVAYDFDPASGGISNERVFARSENGFPDGLTVDAEGYVWSARWDGWQVVRHAPDGSVERVVQMPVARPTSCTFGGPELRHLYVTSAGYGLSAADRAAQPLAGSLFVIETDVAGLPEPRFAG
ncbi:MAG: CBU_1789 family Dot/Icm type IV secretion system effector [Anaerolineae bacterium]